MNLGELGKIILAWESSKHRINLADYRISKEFNEAKRRWEVKLELTLECKLAKDANNVEAFLNYILNNFENLKSLPEAKVLSLLKL